MPKLDVKWTFLRFDQLSTTQLYQLLQLRVAVFVVEQACYYQELDDKDLHKQTHHVIGYLGNEIVAYTRVLAPTVSYELYASIGRVIVDKSCRGMNLGNELLTHSVALTKELWPTASIKISAQEPLENFYKQFGFEKSSSMYLEDNIPHIAMILPV